MTTNLNDKIVKAINEQIAEEIGDSELNIEQKRMLLQKFGVMSPKFTPSERNLILKDERKGR